MNESIRPQIPSLLSELESKCKEIGFTMPSDRLVGSLLKTLISSKNDALVLELGTGIGLSLSWMADGLTENSRLITIDNDAELIKIARNYFGSSAKVEIICADGSDWILNYRGPKFDLIFADAWPGKYSELEETLALVKSGGFYIIDDMLPQPNWPEGHEEKAEKLAVTLENRHDIQMTRIDWSTGIIICTKL